MILSGVVTLSSGEVPIERTLAAMDEAGVERGMICAWYGASGPLISNDVVAGWVAAHPDRLTGIASVDIRRPRPAVHPWTTEMIALATKYPNVYIDTSAYVAHRYPAELVEYMRGHGRRKVLFGSNYPMITPAQALRRFGELALDDEARDLFLGGNASRLFPACS